MATTTNYGWTTPDNTGLVKNGALDIRTLGNSIDTTTKALNPSTTLGDIEYRSSTANTNTRLGIGSTGQVLTVAGGVPTWATAATGGMTQIASTSLSSSATTVSSIPGTYKTLLIVINALSTDSNIQLEFYVNGTTSGYAYTGTTQIGATSATYGNISDSRIRLSAAQSAAASGTNNAWALNFYNYASTTAFKTYDMSGSWTGASSDGAIFQGGAWRNTAAITSCTVTNTGANFDGGTITVFGVN